MKTGVASTPWFYSGLYSNLYHCENDLNILIPGQTGQHYEDDIFKCILFSKYYCIPISNVTVICSLARDLIDTVVGLVEVMACLLIARHWWPRSLTPYINTQGIILYMRPANGRRRYNVVPCWLGAYTHRSMDTRTQWVKNREYSLLVGAAPTTSTFTT